MIINATGRFVSRLARYVRQSIRLLWSAWFNEPQLRQSAEQYTNTRIDEWLALEKITPELAEQMRERIQSPTVTEYLKGFMVQLGLTIFELPFLNNVIIIALALILDELMVLCYFFLVPLLRTIYTLTRIWKKRGQGIPYTTALIIGALPKIGTVAYPLQMSSSHPNLSRFLIRSHISGWVATIPFFGGRDSRLERISIFFADRVLSIIYAIAHPIEGAISSTCARITGK